MGRWKDILRNIMGTKRSARKSGNVTDLSRYRTRRTTAARDAELRSTDTRCSRCRKIVRRVTFYVDEAGKPAGFCKACEPHAKRRDLLPL